MSAPREIAALLDTALRDGVFPSAQLLVGTPKKILIDTTVGDCTAETFFDLASLTKALCTSVRCAQLVDDGKLAYDAALVDLWPHTLSSPDAASHMNVHTSPYARATLRDLLEHTAGAPPGLVLLYEHLPKNLRHTPPAHAWMINAALHTPSIAAPGTAYHYSDVGFLILGGLLEAIDGRGLETQWREEIALPTGGDAIHFRPDPLPALSLTGRGGESSTSTKIPSTAECAPTGFCAWRGRELRGEVNDPNAAACGGVAPHAGLFGRARELHQLSREIFSAFAISTATQLASPPSLEGRGLGEGEAPWLTARALHTALAFDTPRTVAEATHRGGFSIKSSGEYSSMGTWGNAHTIGHLGFTGCSWWIDLPNATWIILLTNRIHLGGDTEKIKAFRPMLHSAIHTWLTAR